MSYSHPLNGYEIPVELWEQILEYCGWHAGTSPEEAIAILLQIGLRSADRASVAIPPELLEDLAQCAFWLNRGAIAELQTTEAGRIFTWATEYLPNIELGKNAPGGAE